MKKFYVHDKDMNTSVFLAIPLVTLAEARKIVPEEIFEYNPKLPMDTLGYIDQDEGGVWFMEYTKNDLGNMHMFEL